jgi:hypothetical protein
MNSNVAEKRPLRQIRQGVLEYYHPTAQFSPQLRYVGGLKMRGLGKADYDALSPQYP